MQDIDTIREQMDAAHFNEEAENIEYMDGCLECPVCDEIILDDEDFEDRVIYCECREDKYMHDLYWAYRDYFESKRDSDKENVDKLLEVIEKKVSLYQL